METLIKAAIGLLTVIVLSFITFRTIISLVKHKIERDNLVVLPGGANKTPNQKPLLAGLYVFPGVDGKEGLVTEEPNESAIVTAIEGLDWSDISFATLRFNEDHFVSVNGSLNDGFSAQYEKGDDYFLADPPPESIDEMKEILIDFLMDKEAGLKKYNFS